MLLQSCKRTEVPWLIPFFLIVCIIIHWFWLEFTKRLSIIDNRIGIPEILYRNPLRRLYS